MTIRFKKIGLWGCLGEKSVAEPALEIVSQLCKLGLEVVIHLHTQLLGGQVAHVPHARLHQEVAPKDLVDRLGFGRGFDHDQGFR